VVLAGGLLLARWLSAEGRERALVLDRVEALERTDVEVLRVDSATAYSLGEARGPTRIAYRVRGATRVRCVEVRRRGGPLSGRQVSISGVSGPIGLEASC
jgi:hypothetical protein